MNARRNLYFESLAGFCYLIANFKPALTYINVSFFYTGQTFVYRGFFYLTFTCFFSVFYGIFEQIFQQCLCSVFHDRREAIFEYMLFFQILPVIFKSFSALVYRLKM